MFRYAAPDERRPVLVLSRQRALDLLRTATVAPITGTIRGLPSEVRVGPEHGLKKVSAVNLDHVITVPQAALNRYVGRLTDAEMEQVCEALDVALGCR